MLHSKQPARLCFGIPRSGKWPGVRTQYLKLNPFCAACGSPEKVEVHHVVPYHTPAGKSLELDFENLITLCMGSGKCHFVWGHLLNWRSHNRDVRMDCVRYYRKIETRP